MGERKYLRTKVRMKPTNTEKEKQTLAQEKVEKRDK